MSQKFNLGINDVGMINEANIEINKINVVGGVNASGKSTASKFLYCFLKAMSLNRKDYALATILPTINKFINLTEKPDPYGSNDLPEKYTVDDKLNDILIDYFKAKDKYKRLDDFFKIQEVFNDWENECDKFIKILLDENENAYSHVDKYLLESKIKKVNDSKQPDSFYRKSYSTILKHLFEDESLLNFEGKSSFYNNSFKSSVSHEPTGNNHFGMFERFMDLESKEGLSRDDFDDFDDTNIYLTEGKFEYINDVFYIDSISYFDLDYYIDENKKLKELFKYKEHLEHMLLELRDDDKKPILSDETIKNIDNVNAKISSIINGKIYRTVENDGFFFGDLYYYYLPENTDEQFNVNISSGIQQISVIQILLYKHKLYPGCYLIIDEPEVNLHPEWQFKFAEILVLLAKELDITIYLNSHSPFFIEAIDAFTEFYDMQNDINYYLTEESEIEGKYDFTKIESNELYKIYNNLGNAYDLINQLRLRKRYKK